MIDDTNRRLEVALSESESRPLTDYKTICSPSNPDVRGWSVPGIIGSIPYSKNEMAGILEACDVHEIKRSKILITSVDNAVESLLWGKFFNEVFTISRVHSDCEFTELGAQHVAHGSVGDTKFMHRLIARTGVLDAIVLRGRSYSELISPYYILKRNLSKPAIIVMAGINDPNQTGPGMKRFISDLRDGSIDGINHEIHDVKDNICSELKFEMIF